MIILCWSAKGGAGATVVAASLALLRARRTGAGAFVIDLGGDVPAVLGLEEPRGAGVGEWLASASATPESLLRLATPAESGLHVVHRGEAQHGRAIDEDAWERIAHACSTAPPGADVVIDAGCTVAPATVHARLDRSLLVTRACYLALRRGALVAELAMGAVLVAEPGRALRSTDVEHALGTPVAAEIPWDPAVARAVDAGLLRARLPHALARALRSLVTEEAAR